ncbi:MAG: dihydroorotate dehydrogenase [Thermoplasmata archaeon]
MLQVEISGIRFKNPVLLASGIMDEQGDSMLRAAREGAGGVVTKSIGLSEREGYQNPTVAVLSTGIINAIGLANPGIENFEDEVRRVKEEKIPVIGSIFGKKEDYAFLARRMENIGVDGVELNLSCPHVKGFGSEIGQDPDAVEDIVKEVKRSVSIPVFAKLTPNITDMLEIAKAASGADALVLINTVRGIAIDIFAKRPVLSNIYGGYSGPGIKPIGVRAVYDVRREMDIPIIGVGGITGWEDAVEYILAGANAVQVGSAIYYRGFSVFREIVDGLETYMKKEGFESIDDFRGMAVMR